TPGDVPGERLRGQGRTAGTDCLARGRWGLRGERGRPQGLRRAGLRASAEHRSPGAGHLRQQHGYRLGTGPVLRADLSPTFRRSGGLLDSGYIPRIQSVTWIYTRYRGETHVDRDESPGAPSPSSRLRDATQERVRDPDAV